VPTLRKPQSWETPATAMEKDNAFMISKKLVIVIRLLPHLFAQSAGVGLGGTSTSKKHLRDGMGERGISTLGRSSSP